MVAAEEITRLKLAIKAAEMYYLENGSQLQISKKMGVSRPTVSRLLQYAKDKGLVKIQI